MSLEDFRNWSNKPSKSCEKIKAKIDLLAEESLDKGIIAIKAWKKSEINKAYLSILNNAMIKHIPVYQVIKDAKENREIVLTKEEFESIADLNQSLRF